MMKGTKQSTISVSSTFRRSMAARIPKITKKFFRRFTRRLVNIREIALVSLVVRVTSFPTGISLSCSWERASIWVKSSSLIVEMIFWPVFCRMMA